jgi:hypothetical protein
MIGKNKKIVIKNFFDTHYSDLVCSPKNLCYHKEGEVYFEFQPKEEIIFLNWIKMVKPLIGTFNINDNDPEILSELYNIMEEWFKEEYNVVGSIT